MHRHTSLTLHGGDYDGGRHRTPGSTEGWPLITHNRPGRWIRAGSRRKARSWPSTDGQGRVFMTETHTCECMRDEWSLCTYSALGPGTEFGYLEKV